ncbi:MAG: class I SAM-dependent methyltransferase [Bacteroidota bacterium]
MNVAGSAGYAKGLDRFIAGTQAISFERLHRHFLAFIPRQRANLLDLGAGIGRDAVELAQRGHRVTAVEPLAEFRATGSQLYPHPDLHWVDDALPDLQHLEAATGTFDFVLSSGVWHHLSPAQQTAAIQRVATLLRPAATFALSLRRGPAGLGHHCHPTQVPACIQAAQESGLATVFRLDNQASLMSHKVGVRWAFLVFQKRS